MAEPERRLAEGARLHDAGRLNEAEAALRAILREADEARRTRPVPALVRLAGVLLDRGEPERAYAFADEATTLAPHDAVAHNVRGMVLGSLGRMVEAERALRTAVDLAPGAAEAHHNLGRVLAATGQGAPAIDAFAAALAIAPDMAPARRAMGWALRDEGRFAEALDLLDRLVADRGESAATLFERGLLLYLLRRPAEALAVLDRAIGADPAAEGPRMRRAHALLLLGDYGRGWPAHDFLFETGHWRNVPFDCPRWTGQPLAGKTVVVWGEMGYGDAIQFVRFVPMLAARGATVVLLVKPTLVRLFASVPGVARVIAIGGPVGPHDFHLPTMALPRAFGATIETLPADCPYLAPPSPIRTRWAEVFPTSARLRVGLVWAGEPRPHLPVAHATDRRRSMAFATLAPLLAVDGVDFVSLQLGDARAAVRSAAPGARLYDPMGAIEDFADTAAIIERLDLVITVCTAAAHLTGALGRPGWVLLSYDACWRWLLDRDDSPWYPSLRLFRQSAPGDWTAPIARATAALTDLSRRHAMRAGMAPRG